MKSFRSTQGLALQAVVVLLIVGLCADVWAQEQTVVIRDFDVSGAGFRFGDGKLVIFHPQLPSDKVNVTATEFFTTFDFILDLPNGIGTNSSKLTPDFKGNGGVQDCGMKALEEVREAPRRGYGPALKSNDIKEGNTYCFLAADGEHYAKLHVIRLDKEQGSLEFTWRYQPKATNRFE